jgi:hypothetical protein
MDKYYNIIFSLISVLQCTAKNTGSLLLLKEEQIRQELCTERFKESIFLLNNSLDIFNYMSQEKNNLVKKINLYAIGIEGVVGLDEYIKVLKKNWYHMYSLRPSINDLPEYIKKELPFLRGERSILFLVGDHLKPAIETIVREWR